MTSKRRLVPNSEVVSLMNLWTDRGLRIGAVDVRSDGVTIYPPLTVPVETQMLSAAGMGTTSSKPETAYEAWKRQETEQETRRDNRRD